MYQYGHFHFNSSNVVMLKNKDTTYSDFHILNKSNCLVSCSYLLYKKSRRLILALYIFKKPFRIIKIDKVFPSSKNIQSIRFMWSPDDNHFLWAN